MRKIVHTALLGLALAAGSLGAGMIVAPSPAHAIPVFDSANYAQNLLTAARTLQQINQQIQSLQNEARMLTQHGAQPLADRFSAAEASSSSGSSRSTP